MLPDNIKPVHCNLHAPASGFAVTLGYAASGIRAFYNLQPPGASFTISSGFISGYQYTFAKPTTTATSTDAVGPIDRWKRIVRRKFHEGIGVQDVWDRSPNPPQEQAGPIDRWKRIVIKKFHETCGSTDTANQAVGQIQNFSTKIVGKVVQVVDTGVKIRGKVPQVQDFSTTIAINTNTLAGATATGGSNPFNSTVAIGGTTIIGPTAPVAAKTVFVSIPNTGISTVPSWANLYQFGASWDYGGGSFSIASTVPVGNNGQNIQIFGFNGVITRGGGADGKEYSSSLKGYKASGIFGNARLNQQINLLVGGTALGAPVVLNPSLLQASQTSWLTAKTISSIVANRCGVAVHWAAQDTSVKDFSLEPGMKGIDVISSMAQRVGATLRWFGNDNYYVAYPNTTVGSFVVPNQALIAQGGISLEPILDLDTGVSGQVNQGMYVISRAFTTSSTPGGTAGVPLPSAGTNNPTVTQVAKVSKLLTDDDPALIFDLPFDYDQVYIQILIAPGQSTGGSNGLGIQNFVTTNPQQVFSFSDVGFANPYIFNTLVGNAYIPQVKVDAALMPDNDAVQAGNFILTVFCTRRGLEGAYEAAQQEAQNNADAVQSRNPQFIKTFQGKINCLFYGVIPLPGMFGSATVDDFTVSGIIENVTFSPPGLLSLDIARYAKINFVQPLNQIGN